MVNAIFGLKPLKFKLKLYTLKSQLNCFISDCQFPNHCGPDCFQIWSLIFLSPLDQKTVSSPSYQQTSQTGHCLKIGEKHTPAIDVYQTGLCLVYTLNSAVFRQHVGFRICIMTLIVFNEQISSWSPLKYVLSYQ